MMFHMPLDIEGIMTPEFSVSLDAIELMISSEIGVGILLRELEHLLILRQLRISERLAKVPINRQVQRRPNPCWITLHSYLTLGRACAVGQIFPAKPRN